MMGNGKIRTDLHPIELRDLVAGGDIPGTLWVDIDNESRHQVALLEKVFDFHPLAVEDARTFLLEVDAAEAKLAAAWRAA